MSSPISSVPSNSRNWPRTVEMPRCLTRNSTLECDGSTVHVPVGIAVIWVVLMVVLLGCCLAVQVVVHAIILRHATPRHGRSCPMHGLLTRRPAGDGSS